MRGVVGGECLGAGSSLCGRGRHGPCLHCLGRRLLPPLGLHLFHTTPALCQHPLGCIYLSIYIYMYTHTHTYINIYIERARKGERPVPQPWPPWRRLWRRAHPPARVPRPVLEASGRHQVTSPLPSTPRTVGYGGMIKNRGCWNAVRPL